MTAIAYLREAGAMLDGLPDEFSHSCQLDEEEVTIFLWQRTPDGRVAQANAMVTWECIEDAEVNPLTLVIGEMLRGLAGLTAADETA